MPLYQVVVLALVQAATEFLPVSSTAHLIIVPWLFGWSVPGLQFDIAVHLGTAAAVLAYFARTWIRLLGLAVGRRWMPPEPDDPDGDLYVNPRLLWWLVAATLPAAAAGLLLKDYVETTLRSPVLIGVMLIAVAGVMAWADRVGRLDRDLAKLTFPDSMAIGVSQALALIPGTSRSGITMSVGLFRGLNRQSAARFSFLLSTPIILGASAKAALDAWGEGGLAPDLYAPFLVGMAISAAAGYAVIAVFLRYLQRASFTVFVYYRIISGIIVLVLASFFGSSIAVTP